MTPLLQGLGGVERLDTGDMSSPSVAILKNSSCDSYDKSVTELLDLMHNLGIKLKSFLYRKLDYLNEWPFPLEILESLAVGSVSDKLVLKIMDKSINRSIWSWAAVTTGLPFPLGY